MIPCLIYLLLNITTAAIIIITTTITATMAVKGNDVEVVVELVGGAVELVAGGTVVRGFVTLIEP